MMEIEDPNSSIEDVESLRSRVDSAISIQIITMGGEVKFRKARLWPVGSTFHFCPGSSWRGGADDEGKAINDAIDQAYSGRGKIERLLCIAKQCKGTDIGVQSLRKVHDELKEHTTDTELYKDVVSMLLEQGVEDIGVDDDWIGNTNNKFFNTKAEIENEVASAKSSLDRAAVKNTQERYADLLFERGMLSDALKEYLRLRDYLTSANQVLQMTLSAVKCAFLLGNSFSVINYGRKIEQIKRDEQMDVVLVGKIRCVIGLTHLYMGKFDLGVKTLSQIPVQVINHFSEIISPDDLSTIAMLSAMASLNRSESTNIQQSGFRELVAIAPQDVRDAFSAVQAASYGTGLALLEAMKPRVWVDMIVGPHVDALYAKIYSRCIIEYANAFKSLSLVSMAEKFNLKSSDMERRLCNLIKTGQLKARINAKDCQLEQWEVDPKEEAYGSCISAGKEFVRSTYNLLLHSAVLRHNLMVSDSRNLFQNVGDPQGGGLDPELRSTEMDEPARQEVGDDGPTQMSQDSG